MPQGVIGCLVLCVWWHSVQSESVCHWYTYNIHVYGIVNMYKRECVCTNVVNRSDYFVCNHLATKAFIDKLPATA